MMEIKVLIVDDSAVVRQSLTEILNTEKQFKVLRPAVDPYDAVEKIREEAPDVIILDIEMPKMDGLSFLKQIMTQYPIPTIICSSLTTQESDSLFKAMKYGAVEIITKPKLGTKQFLIESSIQVVDAVKAASVAKLDVKKAAFYLQTSKKLSADQVISPKKSRILTETTDKVIVIGASTGGTEAVAKILSELPGDSPGIVVVQHMPEKFTTSFANRLDNICKIQVKEAHNGDRLLNGQALIAPGNYHTLLKRSGAHYYVEVKSGPLVSRHRPSVNVLFRSTAQNAGRNALGIILTGMGDDGAEGISELKEAGALTIAQDEASCIVFGMPKEAIKTGDVDHILGLSDIASFIYKKAKG